MRNILKGHSPRRLAIFISGIVTLVQFTGLIILELAERIEFNLGMLLIICLVSGAFSFFLFQYVLLIFIQAKVKLVYKNILTLKTPEDRQEKFGYKDDILARVNEEVVEWMEIKSKEIDRLQHLENYRKEFMGDVSHELKTPIFIIQGYLSTLLEGGMNDPAILRKYLEKAEHSTNRMVLIVQDLETISRFEHGELKVNPSKFVLVKLCKEIYDSLEDKARRKNIHLTFKEDSNQSYVVNADRERIRQVLTNLVVNAINYGNEGGFVRVAFYEMDQRVLVEVKDNGIGIPKADIPRVFERFYRVDKSRSTQTGGTGLGLSIVKHILEAHHQTINIRSAPKIGTTIGFTLEKG